MMEEREPLLGAAVGKKGVGKTFQTRKLIDDYVKGNPALGVPGRRALILDVNNEFSDIKTINIKDVTRFSAHSIIEARRIQPFNDDGSKWTINDIQDSLFRVLHDYRGGLLLLEDINRYTSDNLPNDLIGAICTNRHTDTDIIMHFQSIGRITPKIWQNINWLRFHQQTDTIEKNKQKLDEKTEIFKLAEVLVGQQYRAGNERYFVFIDIDRMKINGNLNKKQIADAIDQYIEENYKKLITPLTRQVRIKDGKAYSHDEAISKIRAQITEEYFV